MSPEPWVRVQAAAVCMTLIATIVLGGEEFALGAGGSLALFGAWMWRRYRHDKLLVNADVPPHRERLDLLVAGDARAALLPVLVLGVFVAVMSPAVPYAASYVLDSVAIIALVATVVYGSSLFDWYVILPRMSGLLGPRPCRRDQKFKTFPRTWREVTRWWYAHRIVAGFFVVYGVALAAGILAAGITGASSLLVEVSVTAVFGTLGAYKKVLRPAAKEFMHPRMVIGKTVSSRSGERRYVYDVAMEGVQIVPTEEYEARAEQLLPDRKPEYEDNPERVPLNAVDEMRDAPRYTGCDRRCVGINWYCIENEDCFSVK
jgi:hypothetical protein